jgi:hypothetical protein
MSVGITIYVVALIIAFTSYLGYRYGKGKQRRLELASLVLQLVIMWALEVSKVIALYRLLYGPDQMQQTGTTDAVLAVLVWGAVCVGFTWLVFRVAPRESGRVVGGKERNRRKVERRYR